jgi:hypothetical protein
VGENLRSAGQPPWQAIHRGNKEMVLVRSRAASALKITTMTAVGAAAAVLAAGCSASGSIGGGSSGNAGSSSHSAAGGMSSAQAVTLAAQQAQRVNSFTGTLSVKMSGKTNGTVAGTIQMRQRPSLLADVDMSTMDIAGQNVSGGAQEIINSQAAYMKMPALQGETGKPWLKLPFSQLKKASGVNLGQLIQQAQSDSPMLQTQMLAAAQNVRTVGTQTIGGVQTTEYTGTYPISAALAKLPASMRGPIQQHLQTMGLTSARFTVWLDAQHQTRKIIVVEHGSSQQMTMNMQVNSINQPVKVILPSASQVATVPTSALNG